MHSNLVQHDYRPKGIRHLAPAELATKRTERLPRIVILHGELGRHRNFKLEETKKFMEPFLPLANVKRCIGCGVDMKRRGQRVCVNCRKLMAVVSTVKSWMRNYVETGYTKYLQNAAGQIRKYRLEPEDLRWL